MTIAPARPVAGHRPAGTRRRGSVVAVAALALGLLLVAHRLVPDRFGHVGSLVDTFLPWCGAGIPVLLGLAAWRRSVAALAAVLVPLTAWLALFGGALADRSRPGGDLIVAEHNVAADNPNPVGTALGLLASGADVLALVEVPQRDRGMYERALSAAYPFHVVLGTVGLWSRWPLSDVRPVDAGMDDGGLALSLPVSVRFASARALRATVATDRGPLAVYVAHLGSVRLTPRAGFDTAQRDRGVTALSRAITTERVPRVVLLGDLNGSTDDRALDPLDAGLRSVQELAGRGFGFTWPATFPVVRIDQILVRGLRADRSWVLPATGSDHRPVAAALSRPPAPRGGGPTVRPA